MNNQLLQHSISPERAQLFEQVCDTTLDELTATGGIGTLAEKSTHAVLKRFYAEDPGYEEVPTCGFVADICRPEGVIEIQTRGFFRMKRKLHAFLTECPVTIVYPVTYRKWLCWVDPATGAVTSPRRSPKTNYGFRVFDELYGIKDFLGHPNLTIQLALMDIEEYKLLDGYGADKKKRATRSDGIPKALIAEIPLHAPSDYRYFLPDGLPQPFSSADLASVARIPADMARTALNVLLHLGCVQRVGKQANAFLYEKTI